MPGVAAQEWSHALGNRRVVSVEPRDFVRAEQCALDATAVDGTPGQRLEAHAPAPGPIDAGFVRGDHAGLHRRRRFRREVRRDAVRSLVHIEEVTDTMAGAVAEVD